MLEDFGHRVRLDTIRDGDRVEMIADETERASVAKRLGLPSLDRLEANATLGRDGERVRAKGRIRASLEQSCVATGDPVPEHLDEAFEVLFLPEPDDIAPDDEIELGEEDCDTVFYEGAAIDLGSAIADTLALSIDPYPRSPAAEDALREAGVKTEEQAQADSSPFAALAKMKKSGE